MSVAKDVEKVALNLLARREHSQQELRQKLVAREFDENAVNEVIAHLAEKNYQSDARFAENYVTMRARNGYGPLHIRQDLQSRGVSDALIDEYLTSEIDWIANARQVRIKRFGEMIPDDFEARAKQMRFLQYRGFTGEQIQVVIKT